MNYELIAIGASWGGLEAVRRVLTDLPTSVGAAVAVAQHRSAESTDGGLGELLTSTTGWVVRDAEDKDPIEPGTIYLAPPDYHLLVEPGHFALSTEDRVQYARPSIDVLFETAAEAYRERVIGVVLTGANEDGAAGLARIKELGGVAVVQDPAGSARRAMPDAALAATNPDAVLRLEEIGAFVYGVCMPPARRDVESFA